MKLRYILKLSILILIASCKTTKIEDKTEQKEFIKFNWIENEINGKQYDKSAISLDLQLINSEQNLKFQFDTGAKQSFVSAKSFDLLLKKDPNLLTKIDTLIYDDTNSDIVLRDLKTI